MKKSDLRKRSVSILFLGLVMVSAAMGRAAGENWTPTFVGAPDPRQSHTTVWTGSQMIIWGGYNSSGCHGSACTLTGGRYNPSTNSWAPTSTTGAPEAREDQTAIWTGTEMIVWGGDYFTLRSNTGGRYTP